VLRLITIPISHYCEKARWALEHAGWATARSALALFAAHRHGSAQSPPAGA
jgi:hypothetical protein